METISTQSNGATGLAPRKQFTPQQRQQLLERFRQSGLKQAEFVAGEGISKASLGKWLQKERRQGKPEAEPVGFQELELSHPAKAWAVELVSPDNWTLRLAQVPPLAIWQQLSRALPC